MGEIAETYRLLSMTFPDLVYEKAREDISSAQSELQRVDPKSRLLTLVNLSEETIDFDDEFRPYLDKNTNIKPHDDNFYVEIGYYLDLLKGESQKPRLALP